MPSNLKRFVDEFKVSPELICIQETWLKPCLDFVIPRYVCLRRDRSDRSGGGCATFIRTGIQYKRVDINRDLECVTVEVWTGNKTITVINFYNPCKQLVLSELDKVRECVNTPVIWVGDFNSHNPLWGSNKKDNNGMVVEEFLETYNMAVINDGRPARFDMGKYTCSAIDLSLSSSNLSRTGEWDVLDRYTLGSDHFPILNRFGIELRVEMEESVSRYKFSLAKWEEFQEEATKL